MTLRIKLTYLILLMLIVVTCSIVIHMNCGIECDSDPVSAKPNKQTVIEMQDSVKKLVLLTKLIQSESGTESFLDKLLVGSVVLNWMERKRQDIDTVIFHPNRFSGVHGKGFRETAESKRAAMLLLENGPIDTTILFFLNPEASTNRKWVRQVMQRELVAKTENHYFYK